MQEIERAEGRRIPGDTRQNDIGTSRTTRRRTVIVINIGDVPRYEGASAFMRGKQCVDVI